MKLGLHVDWKNEPPIREKILFAVIPLLMLIPFTRTFLFPVQTAIEKARDDGSMVEAQIETIRKMLEMTSQATPANTEVIQKRSESQDRVTRILSHQTTDRNQEVANAVNALSARDLTQGIVIHNIALGKEVSLPTYTAIPLEVQLEGGYGTILRYLSALEKIERPFLVREIRLKGSENRGGRLKANLNVWVYLAGKGKGQ